MAAAVAELTEWAKAEGGVVVAARAAAAASMAGMPMRPGFSGPGARGGLPGVGEGCGPGELVPRGSAFASSPPLGGGLAADRGKLLGGRHPHPRDLPPV